jgi:hypothetical protein
MKLTIFPTGQSASEKKIPQSKWNKKDEAFKTVCFKSLKALFSVEADKPTLLCQMLFQSRRKLQVQAARWYSNLTLAAIVKSCSFSLPFRSNAWCEWELKTLIVA